MEVRPIPAFYCCYLLRSCRVPASLYVGSTPNPRRRLQQHNGKGGAVRTRRKTLRPWEMSCVVTGFPSKIAALQFEWAWQNTHVTKRIPAGERITLVPKSRKGRNGKSKIPKPKYTLDDRLKNLHLLLRVPSFARWPLNVRFFCESVWEAWQQAIENLATESAMRSDVKIVLDLKEAGLKAESTNDSLSTHAKGKRRKEAIGKGGPDGVDVGYGGLKDHIEKSMTLFRREQSIQCAVCPLEVNSSGHMAVTCPHGTCAAACHLTCLSKNFLIDEGAGESLLPILGNCPKCRKKTRWIDLVKEMSLRARGAKEVARLTKQSRSKTTQTAPRDADLKATASGDLDDVDEDEVSDDPLPDDWLLQVDDSDDEALATSTVSGAPSPTQSSI